MTTKTPEPQYRATMARNGRKGAGQKLSAKRKAALQRGMIEALKQATNEKPRRGDGRA